MAIKVACPTWFSVGVFTLVQVAIDVETVWNILAGSYPIHGPLHTLPGGLLMALAAIAPGRWGASRLYAAIRRRWPGAPLGDVSWKAAIGGGLIGGVSHVLLDALIHDDVKPFAPWSAGNPLFVSGSFVWVHVACTVVGGAGLLIWWGRVSGQEAGSCGE